jgi:hypothetical protein
MLFGFSDSAGSRGQLTDRSIFTQYIATMSSWGCSELLLTTTEYLLGVGPRAMLNGPPSLMHTSCVGVDHKLPGTRSISLLSAAAATLQPLER